MTEVKFVEIFNGYLIRLDDIISVENYDKIISITYFTYANSNCGIEKTVTTKKISNDYISYPKLLKYFFDK